MQSRRLLADRADHAARTRGAVVGQVVAVDAGDDRVAQAHARDRAGDARGSSGSFQVGLPVLTLQKPQRRVHVSPRIMNVAVPRSQHSPMFGQAASWQTVCRLLRLDLASQLAVAVAARRRHLEPRRLARAERQHVGAQHRAESMPPGLARERVSWSADRASLTPVRVPGARSPSRAAARRAAGGARARCAKP